MRKTAAYLMGLCIVVALTFLAAVAGETVRLKGKADGVAGETGASPSTASADMEMPAPAMAPGGEAPAEDQRRDSAAKAPAKVMSFAFPEQFFIPIIRGGETRSLMVISLAVDVPEGQDRLFRENELRLRDSLLRRLLAHANSGGFDGNFTSEAHLGLLREMLLDTARQILGDAAMDVLIVEIAQQGRG